MVLNFNQTKIADSAQTYINDVLYHSGLNADKYSQQSTKLLSKITRAKKVLLTHSCSAALEMAAILIDLQPGDEVIMPSYTFVSTANAFVLRGAVPVFVDIREDTLNIDEKLIEDAITPKTKAIVPVHYAAVACEMDTIMQIAKKHNLHVIEDAAQCIGATYKGKHLGTIGHIGTLSFHYTKNITSGLGGALLINDDQFTERAKIIWQKGTNREAFVEGQVDKYTWMDIGSSFMMPELSAAVLYSQLENQIDMTKQRLEIWYLYDKIFRKLDIPMKLPFCLKECNHNAHFYYIVLNSRKERQVFIKSLINLGVKATFHYSPLHKSLAGTTHCKVASDMSVTNHTADCIVRMPMTPEICLGDIQSALELSVGCKI